MKKSKIKVILSLIAALMCVCMVFSMTSCEEEVDESEPKIVDRFPNTPSGYTFDLNNESVFTINQKFTFAKEEEGYVNSANIRISIEGLKELSYFDSAITFIWTYESLDEEARGYVQEEYAVTVELDALGRGEFSDQIEISGCRAWKNLSLELEFDGYAIKK